MSDAGEAGPLPRIPHSTPLCAGSPLSKSKVVPSLTFLTLQEEYQGEGIAWHNIDYTDNVGCIHLISKKPTGLFYLLDEESK